MKILVPTDLSPLAKVGVIYAAKLSVNLNAQLVVMNVNHIDLPTRNLAELTENKIIATRRKDREADLRELIKNVSENIEGNLNAIIAVEDHGPLAETIVTSAHQYQCDLIVMGTKGASGIKKFFFGSNAAAVLNLSPIPVLTIPEFAIYRGLGHLVYASDMKNLMEEFSILLPIAKIFNATVQLVHIYQIDNRPQVDEHTMVSNLRKEMNYPKINCHYIASKDVKSGLEQYFNGRGADVLAMFSGKRNFYERIFEKSNTREAAFQNCVPLLTFNKKTVVAN